jgi:hypothetical protein
MGGGGRGASSQVWKVLKKSAEGTVIAEKVRRKNQYRDSTVLQKLGNEDEELKKEIYRQH